MASRMDSPWDNLGEVIQQDKSNGGTESRVVHEWFDGDADVDGTSYAGRSQAEHHEDGTQPEQADRRKPADSRGGVYKKEYSQKKSTHISPPLMSTIPRMVSIRDDVDGCRRSRRWDPSVVVPMVSMTSQMGSICDNVDGCRRFGGWDPSVRITAWLSILIHCPSTRDIVRGRDPSVRTLTRPPMQSHAAHRRPSPRHRSRGWGPSVRKLASQSIRPLPSTPVQRDLADGIHP
ncbi:hypothetical protein BDN71DRAFT_1514635 [Pleurotus eryngii]|uniref:Uncharacterized protein n=1 Tax=Pleurotus eryngii TaxID=5323 RepID=A0A9P5ZG14_PLEER|nr:hypothetical protein BDN71DRAFT_1514635 [Pleurotus eryngii]